MARAALDLVAAEGLAALSMRRLGRGLGVVAMSLYMYVLFLLLDDAGLDGGIALEAALAAGPTRVLPVTRAAAWTAIGNLLLDALTHISVDADTDLDLVATKHARAPASMRPSGVSPWPDRWSTHIGPKGSSPTSSRTKTTGRSSMTCCKLISATPRSSCDAGGQMRALRSRHRAGQAQRTTGPGSSRIDPPRSGGHRRRRPSDRRGSPAPAVRHGLHAVAKLARASGPGTSSASAELGASAPRQTSGRRSSPWSDPMMTRRTCSQRGIGSSVHWPGRSCCSTSMAPSAQTLLPPMAPSILWTLARGGPPGRSSHHAHEHHHQIALRYSALARLPGLSRKNHRRARNLREVERSPVLLADHVIESVSSKLHAERELAARHRPSSCPLGCTAGSAVPLGCEVRRRRGRSPRDTARGRAGAGKV